MNIAFLTKRADDTDFPAIDLQLAAEILSCDPLIRKVSQQDRDRLVRLSLTAGEYRAEKTLHTHALHDPLKLASKLNVRVVFDISAPGKRQAFTALSAYQPAPPTIFVYENTLQVYRENPSTNVNNLRNFLDKLTKICVAHEMYHHLEHKHLEFINLAHKVKIIDLGFIRIERSLSTLSEIAAGAFAKRLLHLPSIPYISGADMMVSENSYREGP